MAHLHHSNFSLHGWLTAHPHFDAALHRGVVWVLAAGMAAMLGGAYMLSFGESVEFPLEIAEPIHVSDQSVPLQRATAQVGDDYFPAQFYQQQLAAREEVLPEQF